MHEKQQNKQLRTIKFDDALTYEREQNNHKRLKESNKGRELAVMMTDVSVKILGYYGCFRTFSPFSQVK